MSRRIGAWLTAVTLLSPLVVGVVTAADDEKKELGWFDKAELGVVMTGGNSESSTFGLKNTLERVWQKARFELVVGAVRAETKSRNPRAIGTPGAFYVDEGKTTTVNAERYYLDGRYDRDITEHFFWFAGGGWDRNEPAGIRNRYAAFGGVGNIWRDGDKVKFRTDYALSYTNQKDVVPKIGADDSFLGARFSWAYWHKFTSTTEYGNDFIVDENLNETSDLRLDMTNWVAVNINKRLALKVSLQLLYDNDPAVELLGVYADPGDTDPIPGSPLVESELEKLDSLLTASLVVNF